MKGKVLVTGAAGFIGSHVAEHVAKRGYHVVGIDDLSGGFLRNVPPAIAFLRGSVTDPQVVERVWKEHGPFVHVYHLAAYAAEGLSHFIRRFNYENNVISSVNVINACVKHGAQCLVFTSSIAVYGKNQLPMTEDLAPRPEDPYGIAKLAVELDLAAAHEMFGLDYVIFRPHNVYGERQNIADRYRNVVGIFMNQIMQGKPMTVFGDGRQVRAFSHIDDVAPSIAAAPDVSLARNQVFNIGGDEPHTVLELAHAVARAFEVDPRIEHLPARNEVVQAFADHRRVQATFGQRSTIALEEGIARMARWARSVGPMTPVTFGAVEVDKNMPPSWVGKARE
jgi:UDP-glucose 4-epimerase